jgi:hypothetical protein
VTTTGPLVARKAASLISNGFAPTCASNAVARAAARSQARKRELLANVAHEDVISSNDLANKRIWREEPHDIRISSFPGSRHLRPQSDNGVVMLIGIPVTISTTRLAVIAVAIRITVDQICCLRPGGEPPNP